MKAILKYPLRGEDVTCSADKDGSRSLELEVKRGSRFLSVKEKYDEPVLYVVSDMEETGVERWTIVEVLTGVQCVDLHRYDLRYLDTLVTYGGALVLHYFMTSSVPVVSIDQFSTRYGLS